MTKEEVGKYISRMSLIDVYEFGECVSVASFNRGNSNFICSEDCYVLVNGNHISNWLFEEAVQILKELPDPKEMYKLVKKYKKMMAFT